MNVNIVWASDWKGVVSCGVALDGCLLESTNFVWAMAQLIAKKPFNIYYEVLGTVVVILNGC